MWEEIKTTDFSALHCSEWVSECVCVENTTHAGPHRCCVINGQAFLLRDADYEMF